MTEDQITIADIILQHLLSNAGRSPEYNIDKQLKDFKVDEINCVKAILQDELCFIKLLNENGDPYVLAPDVFRLTVSGYSAAKVGLKQFFNQQALKEKLEMDKLTYATKNAKYAKRFAWASIVISITIGLISNYSKIFKETESIKNHSNCNCNCRQDISLPTTSVNVVDSLTVGHF